MKLNEREIKFTTDTYAVDDSMYIGAWITEENEPDDFYGDVTVCIPYMTAEDEIILDTNNSPELIKEMIKQKLIKKTGEMVGSGFCVYPIAKVTEKFYREVIS